MHLPEAVNCNDAHDEVIQSVPIGTEEASIPAPWTTINKAKLIALRDAPILMCNTAYGQFEEPKKRDVEQAYQTMSTAEKELFKQKMVEINEAGANAGQSLPPTPTPV